ncbi:MAG: hypothetical protein H6R26_285, partial [Proteobacteria bacterium]|nr:hypothetical protein [Pseudomonadota bacterium]
MTGCPSMLRRLSDRVLKPAVLAGGLASFVWGVSEGADVSEYALKAAFIYNFAKFIEWPDRVDGRLHLCAVGDEMLGAELERLESRLVGSLR